MQCPDPSLQYIRCALSYQNQLLAEIRSLLEQMGSVRTWKNSGLAAIFSGGRKGKFCLRFSPWSRIISVDFM